MFNKLFTFIIILSILSINTRTIGQEVSASVLSFNDVYFADENNGWIVGDEGLILSTHDGGKTFTRFPLGMSQNLYAVQVANARDGWIVGQSEVILHTDNGGETWDIQRLSGFWAGVLRDVQFLSQKEGWAVGTSNTILRTKNGGMTWQKVSTQAITAVEKSKKLFITWGFLKGQR